MSRNFRHTMHNYTYNELVSSAEPSVLLSFSDGHSPGRTAMMNFADNKKAITVFWKKGAHYEALAEGLSDCSFLKGWPAYVSRRHNFLFE